MRRALKALNTRENRLALLIALALVLLTIFTAGAAPLWIYQGF